METGLLQDFRKLRTQVLGTDLGTISYSLLIKLKSDLKRLKNKMFLPIKIFSYLMAFDIFVLFLCRNNIKNAIFGFEPLNMTSFFTGFILAFLIWMTYEEYLDIKNVKSKYKINHLKLTDKLEREITFREEEFYSNLDKDTCEKLANDIYEYLAIDKNLDASMAEKIKESVQKNLERFVFRDPYPKKVSKYYDLIKKE